MHLGRIRFVIAVFCVGFAIVMVKLFQVTILPYSGARSNGRDQTDGMRGSIIDRKGRTVAISVPGYALYARPKRMSQALWREIVQTLVESRILSQAQADSVDTNRHFVYLRDRMSTDEATYLRDLIAFLKENRNLPTDALTLERTYERFYPYPALVDTLGVIGTEGNGLMGLEYAFNEEMKEQNTIYTSLDAEVATIAAEELQKAVTHAGATGGSVGIMDLRNTEIVALVGAPTFDPNQLDTLNQGNIRNMAVSYIYEPGSVMKVFSGTYFMDQGVVTPEEPMFYCDGSITVHGVTIHDAGGHKHGWVNLTTAIQKSCNSAMVYFSQKAQEKPFYQTLQSLSFGTKLPLPLTGVEKGILREPNQWSALSFPAISIGQEIGITTLQLLNAVATLGTDGVYHSPTLVRSVKTELGADRYHPERTQRRVFSVSSTRAMLNMMGLVLQSGGTGTRASVDGVHIAGKTGTGQIASAEGGYLDMYNTTFIGLFPLEQPRYAMVVALHRIQHGSGGATAAPVFASIVRRMLTSGTVWWEQQS